MKLLLKISLLLLLPVLVKAQTLRQIDSLSLVLRQAANDTIRMNACSLLGAYFDDVNADSGLYYCKKAIAIADKLDLQLNKAMTLGYMAWPLMKTGNYPEALRVINQGFKIAEDPSNREKTGKLSNGQTAEKYRISVVAMLFSALEYLYLFVGDYEKEIAVARQAIQHSQTARDTFNLAGIYPDIGDSYLQLNRFDSALFYQQQSLYYYSKLPFENRKFEASTYTSIGTIYEKMDQIDLARENYQKAILLSELHGNPRHAGNACLQLANLYISLKKADSAFLYAKKALEASLQGGYKKEETIAYRMISDYYYDQHNQDSSFAYLRRATILGDSLAQMEKAKLREFQVAAFHQQLALQQQEQEQIKKEGKQKTIAIIALLTVFSTIGFLLFRNNRQKQKANHILQEKNIEIEQTLSNLKTTQKQLIQAEKMASLGELTTGIAHEIQNPLNFVNNFSEVNRELLSEMQQEIEKGNISDVKIIAKDVIENEDKITYHGKRAEAIVKGMLQHSRAGSGQKEPTDINALCDEYLRLAFHGFRAKDKSFQAAFETEFDPTIGKIEIVPQDIGRVVLNLVNNSFYSVNEKAKTMPDGYSPLVKISTRRLGAKIEILVADNGNGIPEKIREKIFQPFFTTKPTGQGTGLGLSLSYDIVKAHGGELKVESKDGVGSQFTIIIPA